MIIEPIKLEKFIETEIVEKFNQLRLKKLNEIDILAILKNKNPYLYRAKSLNTPEEIIKAIIDAFLSSQEETIFGNRMEELAIFVCKEVFGGKKLSQLRDGNPDLKFVRDGITYYVEIKSGPNWGNSSQISKLMIGFKRIRHELESEDYDLSNYRFINGCIYGKANMLISSDEDSYKHYYKICGQAFWELISGDINFYINIIKPLAREVEKKDNSYKETYDSAIIRSAIIFSENFLIDYKVDWNKLVAFTSKNL